MRNVIILLFAIQFILAACGAARAGAPRSQSDVTPTACPSPTMHAQSSEQTQDDTPGSGVAAGGTAEAGQSVVAGPSDGTPGPEERATHAAIFDEANPPGPVPTGLPTELPLDPNMDPPAPDPDESNSEPVPDATSGVAAPGQAVTAAAPSTSGTGDLPTPVISDNPGPGDLSTPVISDNPGAEGRPTATPCP